MTDIVTYVMPLPIGSPPELGPGWTELKIRRHDESDVLHATPGSDLDVLKESWILDVYHLRGLTLRPTPPAQLDPNNPGAWRPLIIDLGACTGIFTALACRMFPTAKVIAVEPNGENFALLEQNTRPFADRVQCVKAAVGASAGNVSTVGEGATGHTETAPSGLGDVEQVTLERLIGNQMVALLKIDIEGAEYAVLDACPSDTLGLVDRIAMEFHGPEMAPWAHPSGHNAAYGEMLHKLAYTHDVNVRGTPDRGGELFAHRYPV